MKKRVLITGASGFVGFHLLNEALAAGLEVFAAIRSNSNIKHLSGLPIQFVNLDFSSVDALRTELEDKKYNYVIHAAGITKAKTEEAYNKINAEFSKNLALAVNSLSYPIEKFVFISSLAALGPLNDFSALIEDKSAAQPVTSYGKSKLLAENYLSDIKGLPLLIFRPTAVYGPREKDILILFKSIYNSLEPHIGDFAQQLSFIYVKDLARIVISALDSEIQNCSYNISDGHIYTRYALADITKKLLHKKTFKFHLPVMAVSGLAAVMDFLYKNRKETPALNKEKMAELTAVNWACSIKNLESDLGFIPRFNLEQGLSETLQWYKNNNWL